MPDTLEIRTVERKNVKRLSLPPEARHEDEPSPKTVKTIKTVQASTSTSVKEQLDSLEILVDFKLDLIPEDLKLRDLVTTGEAPSGMSGQVSLVRHAPSGVVMARRIISVLHNAQKRRAVQKELQIMRDCSSQFLVQCYGAFYDRNVNEGTIIHDQQGIEGRISICMELMDLGSLAHISRRCGPIRIDVLGKIAEAVLGAITYLYSNFKIMHRNLKPSKILLNSLGQIKLSDFRASGKLMNSFAETVTWSETCYMSPERIYGQSYTIKAETWSFGLTIIELALGEFPYQYASNQDDIAGEGVDILNLLEHISRDPAPRLPESDVFPDILHRMIEKCMQKDPRHRSSPVELYEKDDFIQASKRTPVDLTAWIASCNIHRISLF